MSNNSIASSENIETQHTDVSRSVIERGGMEQNRRRSNAHGERRVSVSRNSLQLNHPKDSRISNVTINGEYSGYKTGDIERPNISTLNVNDLREPRPNNRISQTLISEMLESGNDETRYMTYFKKFTAFHEKQKTGILMSEIELEDEFLPNIAQSNKYTRKKSRIKRKTSSLTNTKTAVLQKEVDTFNEEENLKSNLKLNGQLCDRVLLRTEILTELKSLSFCAK